MGRMSLQGMLELNGTDTTLRWHLMYNHYPPLPVQAIEIAKQAIYKADNGEWNAEISLEDAGISWRGKNSVPVSACIEAWHLEDFLDNNDN